jgi:VWFA-related protein
MSTRLHPLTRAALSVLLLITLAGFTPTPPPAEDGDSLTARITQVDTEQFPNVTAYVSVVNAAGDPVAINADQIELLENGQPVKVEGVSSAGDTGPLATILVIDTSGSMNSGGKLEAAKAAAKAYVEQARPDDLIGLLSFNTGINYIQPLTKDRDALLAAIGGLKALEDTAMYDALKQAMQLLEPIQGRSAIIVMTDGLDNRSKMSPLELVQKLNAAGLTISTIGLGNPKESQGAITSLDEAGLKALANQAGGQYGYANDAASLTSLYERYGRALQSEYMLTYTSPSDLRDGVNRALTVRLASGAAAEAEPVNFNPGGLVPEVARPASWLLFAGVLVVLLLLVAVPLFFGRLFRRRGEAAEAPAGRVKLESAGPPPKKTRAASGSAGGKVKLKG